MVELRDHSTRACDLPLDGSVVQLDSGKPLNWTEHTCSICGRKYSTPNFVLNSQGLHSPIAGLCPWCGNSVARAQGRTQDLLTPRQPGW